MWNIFEKKEEETKVEETTKKNNFQLPAIPVSFSEIMKPQEKTPMEETRSGLFGDSRPDLGDLADQGSTSEADSEPRSNLEGGNMLKKVIRTIVLGLVFLMPLFFLTTTAPGDVLSVNKQVLIYGAAMAGLLMWLGIIIRQGGLILRLSGLEWGVLAVIAAGLAASIFSANAYRSFTSSNGFITLASLAVLFFLTVNFFDKKGFGKLNNTFLSGSSLAILAGILNIWGVPVFKWVSWLSYKELAITNIFNTAGSPSGLGSLSVLVFILALSQYFYPIKPREAKTTEETRSDLFEDSRSDLGETRDSTSVETEFSKFRKVLIVGSIFVSGLSLLILDWWVFYTALAVGAAAVLLSPVITQKLSGTQVKIKTSHLVAPLIILVLSIVFIFGNKYLNFGISRLLLKQAIPLEISLAQSDSASIAREVISATPVFGMGTGNFSLAYDKFKPSSINATPFWNTRFPNSSSELFDLLTEGGILALAAFAFLLILVLRRLKNWKIAPAFTTVLALFFLYPFGLVMMFAFWLIIGLIAISNRNGNREIQIRMEDASLSSILSSLVFVLVIVFGLIGGYVLSQKYRGEVYFARAAKISINTEADLDKVITLMSKAVDTNNNEDLYLNNLANLLLKKTSFAINDKTLKPEEARQRLENLTRTTVQIANQLASNHKNEAINWFNAAFIYQNLIGIIGGADEAALAAYKEYTNRSANDPKGYERIAGIYLTRADNNSIALQNAKNRKQEIKNENEIKTLIDNDYKNAKENYKKAIELKKDLLTALYNLGAIYEREGKLKEAIKQLESVKLLELNNPGLIFELGLLYYRDNQKDKALAEMGRAVFLFKDYSNARWYLALMLEEKGELDMAIEQLEEILKLEVNKDNQTVKDKLAALKKGKREFPPGKITSRKPLE